MTDPDKAVEIYIEPITLEIIAYITEKGILIGGYLLLSE